MAENPWETLSSKEIYATPWFRVREDQVIRPDGRPGTYSVVSAARVAAGVVPLWRDGSITLVGQYRYPLGEYSWEIPEGGGSCPESEALDVARQELLEETGLRAEVWTHLGRIHTSNCFTDEVCHIFVATELTQGEPRPDPEEILQLRREPLSEAVAMAADGRITDSITIGSIFRLTQKLASNSRLGRR